MLLKLCYLFLLVTVLWSVGCVPVRPIVAPGVVPEQAPILSSEERYGHEVFSRLSERYQLVRDDQQVNRVRDIVDKLTHAAKADHNPWHVYLFVDDNFKNAAATRGNFIFVWTGMLKAVQDDDELAVVLAHEIAHSLAGHTEPEPAEETGRILAGTAGGVAREVLAQRSGLPGLAIALSEVVVKEALEAMLVNPITQQKEYEADQIGMFLMADAGIDPEVVVRFWDRVKDDPAFAGMPLAFLSSHPPPGDRAARLRRNLPLAHDRYLRQVPTSGEGAVQSEQKVPAKAPTDFAPARGREQVWLVIEPKTGVFKKPERDSEVLAYLDLGSTVVVENEGQSWLKIYKPLTGFVRKRDMAPSR